MRTTTALYSQPQTEQDSWVLEKTEGQVGGYFIEIGGFDGLYHSNTRALEEYQGWTGLLVEPSPIMYPELVKNRPNCVHANVAIGAHEGPANFICGHTFSGLVEYMPEDWYQEHRRRGNPFVTVPTITLNHLLDGYNNYFAPLVIDYLSLDVEGAECAILEEYLRTATFPSIRFMTVEFRKRETLEQLLKITEPHFHLDKVQAWDAFFVNKVLARWTPTPGSKLTKPSGLRIAPSKSSNSNGNASSTTWFSVKPTATTGGHGGFASSDGTLKTRRCRSCVVGITGANTIGVLINGRRPFKIW